MKAAITYAEREAAMVRAMAERTLADPRSHPEDVLAATRSLTRATTKDLSAEIRALGNARRPWIYAALFYELPPEPVHGINGLLHFAPFTRRIVDGKIVSDAK